MSKRANSYRALTNEAFCSKSNDVVSRLKHVLWYEPVASALPSLRRVSVPTWASADAVSATAATREIVFFIGVRYWFVFGCKDTIFIAILNFFLFFFSQLQKKL